VKTSWAGATAALSAASVTVPHALGLGLLAFAPLEGVFPVGAMALWNAALPVALLTVLARRECVLYAPSTAVALLYGAMLAIVMGQAQALHLNAHQALAVTAAAVLLAFALQWALGALRLAALARFMPVSVTQGFAAGVGLAMLLAQWHDGFGAGAKAALSPTLVHAAAAVAVLALTFGLARRWPALPSLLPAVLIVALLSASAPAGLLEPASPAFSLALFPIPEWSGFDWQAVAVTLGPPLASLAMLMAIVNSLDVLVFEQELALDHGLRADPNTVMRRECLVGMGCALLGLIPATTSGSRTRLAFQHAGQVRDAGFWHAAWLTAVALTGHLWLHAVPMAALSGALLVAAVRQVPMNMVLPESWRRARDRVAQSWFVAVVFSVAGGASALVAGLVVATFQLLQTSAASALRREHLDGQLRSRRLRRPADEQWVSAHLHQLAVFELQGIVSFGVAVHVAEQVQLRLRPEHRWVLIDATRVPAWDATGHVHLSALVRDLTTRGIRTCLAGIDSQQAERMPDLRVFADLDHALEWVEDELLAQRPASAASEPVVADALGELGQDLQGQARERLLALLARQDIPAGSVVFEAGHTGRELYFVAQGHITLATAPEGGIRLATVDAGQAFGEMAFLNGIPRTAYAVTTETPARLLSLRESDFAQWAREHPDAALGFMSRLAQMSNRRHGLTSRQLRAALG
jgi:SulP family sulfate permease